MAADECEKLISYIAGELSEPEKAQFKEHVKQCPSCATELSHLQGAWFALSYDRNEEEAPRSLKSEVMDYVCPDQSNSPGKKSFFSNGLNAFKKSFTPLTATLATLLLIGWFGLLWDDVHLRGTMAGHEKETVQEEPIQVKDTFIFQSGDPSSKAEGVAYLISKGNQKKLIMVLNHIPKPEGKASYQAWLLYNGKYQNCGTFQPNQNGKGVLTYRLSPETEFEDIEITLEPHPDYNNHQPHGQKVMETL